MLFFAGTDIAALGKQLDRIVPLICGLDEPVVGVAPVGHHDGWMSIAGTVADNKAYDGNTLATLSNIGGVTTGVGAETLVLNGPLAADINFNTKDVLTANTVTATGYSLADGTSGGLASNYQLTSTTSTAEPGLVKRTDRQP